MKRFFICFVLALLLIFPTTAFAAPSSWALEEMAKANDLGFLPKEVKSDYKDKITREEYCVIAVNFIAIQYGYSLDEFMEVLRENTNIDSYDDYDIFEDTENPIIKAAWFMNIVNGVGENKFSPDTFITRQEAAVMLSNAYKYYSISEYGVKTDKVYYNEIKFKDLNEISYWAKEAVSEMTYMEVMNGVDSNNFAPLENYTLEQCLATFLRLYENAPISKLKQNISSFEDNHVYDENKVVTEIYEDREIVVTEKYSLKNYTVTYGYMGGVPHGGQNYLYVENKDGKIKNIASGLMAKNAWGTSPDIQNIKFSPDEEKMYFDITGVRPVEDNDDQVDRYNTYDVKYQLTFRTLELKIIEEKLLN